MKKWFILFCFVLLCFTNSKSQGNLVPNPNFEIFSSCPNNISQINYCTGWISASAYGSPDYFNTCATYSSGVSVPSNVFGYQPDKLGGGAYVGLYAFNRGVPNNGREYIQIKLNDTLKAGRKYLASMYVSRANFDFAISTMGMYFTNSAIYQSSSTVSFINIPNPQVKNKTPLTDTLNWMLVQDTVTGTGTERYLTIGNFSYDSLSDTLRTVPYYQNGWYAYYYIDGVSVINVAEIGINELGIKNAELRIWPNPAKDKLFISLPKYEEKVFVEIQDINGRIVFRADVVSENGLSEIKLDVENGVYLINLKTENISGVQKLIIAK